MNTPSTPIKPIIVGIVGKAGSGKDTLADILVEEHGFVKVSLADPIKRFCQEVLGYSDEQLWGSSKHRNAADARHGHLTPDGSFVTPSPRHALQALGTEWGRGVSPRVWIDYALGVAKEIEHGARYSAKRGLNWFADARPRTELFGGVVIPDIRFQNELDAIKAAGGLLVRMLRPTKPLEGAAGLHQSETEQDGFDPAIFDWNCRNTGTIEELQEAAQRWLCWETVPGAWVLA